MHFAESGSVPREPRESHVCCVAPSSHYNRLVRITRGLTTLFILFTFSRVFAAPQRKSADAGTYSMDSISVWKPSAPPKWAIISPNGRERIVVRQSIKDDLLSRTASIVVNGKPVQLFADHVGPEVLWAPDSNAFAETYSSEGAVGLFHVLIYNIRPNGLTITEPTNSVTKEFLSHPRRCFFPENPNIAAIEWINGSSELLVAAETLPHSNCDDMGTFRAYIIQLPSGNIVKEYNQLQAKKLFWRHLGEELRAADDDCVRNPKSCWIPQLHSESK
jgi:hypothetical protein